jgi:F-type H+-transporting ATPase subunit delta
VAAIASRYARALVEVVLEQRLDAEIAREQLNSFAEAVRESVELRRVWESPAVTAEQKRAVLDAIVGQMGAFKAIRNLMAVIIDHRRIPMLDEIARHFAVELDAQLGFVEAQISSARQLSTEEKRELESQVERLTGKKVRAHYALDAGLLGGVMVRVGSTIYDGSIRGQLEKMKQELITA